MKAYELLILYKDVFVCLHRHGLNSESIRDIDLFKAYKSKIQAGEKVSSVIDELSRKFKKNKTTIKRIISDLDSDLKM